MLFSCPPLFVPGGAHDPLVIDPANPDMPLEKREKGAGTADIVGDRGEAMPANKPGAGTADTAGERGGAMPVNKPGAGTVGALGGTGGTKPKTGAEAPAGPLLMLAGE